MPQLFTEVRQLREENSSLRAQTDIYRLRLDTLDQYLETQVGNVLNGIKRLERLSELERENIRVHFKISQMDCMSAFRETERPPEQELATTQKVRSIMGGNETDSGVHGSSGDMSMTSGAPQNDFGRPECERPPKDDVHPNSMQECLEREGTGGKAIELPVSHSSTIKFAVTPPSARTSGLVDKDPPSLSPSAATHPEVSSLPPDEPVSLLFHESTAMPPAFLHPNSPMSTDPTLLVSKPAVSYASHSVKRKADDPPLEEGSQPKRPRPGRAAQQKGGQRAKRKTVVKK